MIITNFVKHKRKWKIPMSGFLIVTILCLFLFNLSEGANKPNENSLPKSRIGRRVSSGDFTDSQNIKYENCSKPAVSVFPADGLTRDQRQHGWIIFHIILLIYGFFFLATVCDDFLVPSVKQICSSLRIDENVVGATIVAAVASCPQLFVNFIGTFITKGDIGVSTVVGSAVFRVLVIAACCGLFATSYLQLHWWPITRDCLMYSLTILALLCVLSDGQIWWYEAVVLILVYFGYVLIMFCQPQMSCLLRKCLRKFGYCRTRYTEVSEFSAVLANRPNNSSNSSLAPDAYQSLAPDTTSLDIILKLEHRENEVYRASPWCRRNQTIFKFCLCWPMTFLLWLTLPDHEHPSLKYLTFGLSTLWLAVISYAITFLITVIGDTFNIPDAVSGLTILTFGLNMPGAVSSIIATRQDRGCRAMSKSLGANTFDILLSLGLPWFIKTFFFPEQAGQKFLSLACPGLRYAAIMFLVSLLVVYSLLVCHKFALKRFIGAACLIIYFSFVVIASICPLIYPIANWF